MPSFTSPYPRIDPHYLETLKQRTQQVQQAIERGEAWMRYTFARRAKLLRRRNHLKATTKDLPIEILSLIFRHATSTHDASSTPQCQISFRIAHTCSHWREIALSTPQMWTAFRPHYLWKRDFSALVETLRFYFANIGNVQFSLKMDLRGGWSYPDLTDVNQVLLAHENALKIHSFTVHNNYPFEHFPSAFAFPNLEDLTLETPGRRHDTDLSALLKLKSLTLHGFTGDVRLPSSQLVKLHLVNIDQSMCANMLKHCPQLKEFANVYHSTFLHDELSPELEFWDTNLSFYYLEDFTWSCMPHASSDIILSRIRLPAAKVVRWIHNNRVPVNDLHRMARMFFSNLPKTVTTLAFERTSMLGFPVSLLKYIFTKNAQVNEVICRECTLSSAIDFFSVLVPLRIPVNHNDGTMYLPSLKSLTIAKGWHLDEHFRGPLIHSLARAQIQRHLFGIISPQRLWRPNSHFRFNLNDITEVYLEHSEEHCRVMREMRRNGTNIEIFVNGEELTW